MYGIWYGLELGKRSLLSQQLALNITSHNIANVNTPGFSRQQAILETTHPLDSPQGKLGTGVNISTVRRLKDLFLDSQYRNESQSLGRWGSGEKTLTQIQDIFNEPKDSGLGAVMDEFWKSWEDLANHPESKSARTQVREKALKLTNLFHHLSSRLEQLKQNVDEDIKINVETINTLSSQIAELNFEISRSELGGQKANDLRDKRDLLIDQLSSMININTVERKNGTVSVYLGGMSLIEGNSVNFLTTKQTSEGDSTKHVVIWELGQTPVKFFNGTLKGLLDARDEIVSGYIGDLDTLAANLVSAVNSVHQAGYGLDGSTGNSFFNSLNTRASDISVDELILNDLDKISASKTGAVGDNANALQIAALKDAKVMERDSTSLSDFYLSVIGILGVKTQEAQDMKETQKLLVESISNSREAVRGVSLDEEMANLIKYQHAYEAAARVITSMDEVLNTIIYDMGIVGT